MLQAPYGFEKNQEDLLRQEVSKKRLLIADSDAGYCYTLSKLLASEGFQVTTCSRTLTALNLIKAKSFDFVISEHSSNGVNGVMVLETAKRLNWTTPVILTADLYEMDSYIEAMHRGALDYICKPNYAEIQRLVRSKCCG